jgi:BolA protein
MQSDRYDKIRARLSSTLAPTELTIQDDGHLHVGHAGASSGGHFSLRIVSSQFVGLRALNRHQLIYRSLGELMQTDIHALSITALTPEESRNSQP